MSLHLCTFQTPTLSAEMSAKATLPCALQMRKGLNKTIWLLWLQGWDQVPWLHQQISKSWETNNPDWKVEYVSLANLPNYVTDIDYIYDLTKQISPQIKSDIIRASLLKNHGGVWADSTMLCVQPLDHWIHEAVEKQGFWMYRGDGAKMDISVGPAIWFMASYPNSIIASKLKSACDQFWQINNEPDTTGFLDARFKHCFETDDEFRQSWSKVPSLDSSADGQAHCFAKYNSMIEDYSWLKLLLLQKPPYVLKYWSWWHDIYPDITVDKCRNSNGFFALELAKKGLIYKHEMK